MWIIFKREVKHIHSAQQLFEFDLEGPFKALRFWILQPSIFETKFDIIEHGREADLIFFSVSGNVFSILLTTFLLVLSYNINIQDENGNSGTDDNFAIPVNFNIIFIFSQKYLYFQNYNFIYFLFIWKVIWSFWTLQVHYIDLKFLG